MSSTNQGRQSPPPEQSSDKQTGAPSSGQGISQGGDNKDTSAEQLKDLSSNPKGVLEDHAAEIAKKSVGDKAGETRS